MCSYLLFILFKYINVSNIMYYCEVPQKMQSVQSSWGNVGEQAEQKQPRGNSLHTPLSVPRECE